VVLLLSRSAVEVLSLTQRTPCFPLLNFACFLPCGYPSPHLLSRKDGRVPQAFKVTGSPSLFFCLYLGTSTAPVGDPFYESVIPGSGIEYSPLRQRASPSENWIPLPRCGSIFSHTGPLVADAVAPLSTPGSESCLFLPLFLRACVPSSSQVFDRTYSTPPGSCAVDSKALSPLPDFSFEASPPPR